MRPRSLAQSDNMLAWSVFIGKRLRDMHSLGNPNFILSPKEQIISKRNRLFFSLRRAVAFRRNSYKEYGCGETQLKEWLSTLSPPAREDVLFLLNKFHFHYWADFLSLEVMKKNLATLWIMERMMSDLYLHPEEILEPGCQDFNRLPAIHTFFQNRGIYPTITGLELDPFRILQNLFSRHDLAQYYRSLCKNSHTEYFGADFFHYRPSWPSDLIFAFYPFVSPHPALAWGLPEEFGNPDAWLESIFENLRENGQALVLHQGNWEEEEFDEALKRNPGKLSLLRRERLICPFYPELHPSFASLYTRLSSC